MNIEPDIDAKGSVAVNPNKLKDGNSLLEKHFGYDWESSSNLRFYKDAIKTNSTRNAVDQDEQMCYPLEDEDDAII